MKKCTSGIHSSLFGSVVKISRLGMAVFWWLSFLGSSLMTENKNQARPQQRHFTVKFVSQVTVWACDGSKLCAVAVNANGKME
jgi:hypothetical protein